MPDTDYGIQLQRRRAYRAQVKRDQIPISQSEGLVSRCKSQQNDSSPKFIRSVSILPRSFGLTHVLLGEYIGMV